MTIKPGEKLFQFASKQDWINKAQRIWRFHGVRAESTVCVDQQGRICTIGLHFMAAERDNAYPIEVFMQRPDMLPPNAMHTASTDQDMKGVCDEVAKK